MVAIRLIKVCGAIHLIGKVHLERLNLPEKIYRPTYLMTSLKADLYLTKSSASVKGKPPSLDPSGCL